GLGSLLAALAGSAEQLIAFRAFQGIGAAFLMPATLSIIVHLFPANERGRAIGFWAATAGGPAAPGPTLGGPPLARLFWRCGVLEHFYWGSVFLVNVPIVVIALVAGFTMIPNSRDPSARRLDPVGAALSIVGLGVLLYAIIEGPVKGWTSTATLAAFGISVAM